MRAKPNAGSHSWLNFRRIPARWKRATSQQEGFTVDHPIVILQSDDWGRTGIRDRQAWEQLCEAGVNLGERAYDFYSLETADDVAALVSLLARHRDSVGRPASLGMNFILANVDFGKVVKSAFSDIYLRNLFEGLPDGWERPGLFAAYQEGIMAGILSPALHGLTHFCCPAVRRHLQAFGKRGDLLRRFWTAGVPYIHWRMPWVGFEYWDLEDQRSFLSEDAQREAIHSAAECFMRFFSRSPRSACAPGYRANYATHKAWAAEGIRVAQNGTGGRVAPHWDDNGILHLYRTIDFEPVTDEHFDLAHCLRTADECFARGVPAIVSVHSINFHSTSQDFRSRTLKLLDQFLTILEAKYSNLLYLRDDELCDVIASGKLASSGKKIQIRSSGLVPVATGTGA